ncbi:MAG: 30S ribosomal protein S12 methylthiotransferase RimO [bacterium]
MTKVYFVSLGCPKNLVDSENIMGSLEKHGVGITESLYDSDIVIINTCGFIKPALKETEHEIKKILQTKANKKLYVYGCAVNRAGESLIKKFPEVTSWFSIKEKEELVKTIIGRNVKFKSRLLTTSGFAYLKIADGCSNHCSYCTIPQIKGEFKSIKYEEILNEARAMAGLGTKELILIAQDTARYGLDLYGKPMLAQLLSALSKIEGIEWLRVLYAHPRSITPDLISEIKNNPKVCKYLDMPVQHINDRILELMNRGITKREIIEIIKKLKGVVLRTTIMVGFPTETENEFRELYDFIKKGYFDWFGVFRYIQEEKTEAAFFKPLPQRTIDLRLRKILDLQQEIIKKKNLLRLNKYYKILVHYKGRKAIGHTEFCAPEIDSQIIINSRNIESGKMYFRKINKIRGTDLYA